MPNGSPYEHDKPDVRLNLAVARVTETGLPLVYCNQVGGQDELVFDGASFVLNADRRLAAQGKAFEEQLLLTRWRQDGEAPWTCVAGEFAPTARRASSRSTARCAWACATTSRRTVFPGVVLGLSGGIDSALSAAVAVDALGAERVHAVMMPSRYTSRASLDDAAAGRRGARHPPRQRRDRARGRGVRRDAGAAVRGPRPRHHRGEHPGPDPRRDR